MFSVKSSELPEHALLQRYREGGAYTDCYCVHIDRKVSQADYIRAFYTTLIFRAERLILKWVVSKPSTDEEANLLAEAKTDQFAAWYVEARRDEEILLSDFRDRTRSWLMTEASARSTRLYFGSAVVQKPSVEASARQPGMRFSLLLEFHKLYSRMLLSSARRRLLR